MRFVAFEGGGEAITALQGGHIQVFSGDAAETSQQIKAGSKVRVATAGVDRKPSADKVAASVTAINAGKVTLAIPAESAKAFRPAGLARVWVEGN